MFIITKRQTININNIYKLIIGLILLFFYFNQHQAGQYDNMIFHYTE